MHLEHFVPNASLEFFSLYICCIEDQLLFLIVYWLWWVIIQSWEWGWLEEQRVIRNKSKNQDCYIAFNLTHLKTWSKFLLRHGLCFKYPFWLNVTKRIFGMQIEFYQKCKVDSIMSESAEAYPSMALAVIWIS